MRFAGPPCLAAAVMLATAAAGSAAPPDMPTPRPRITDGATIAPDAVDRAALAAWIREHGRAPVDFLVGEFADHDVVLLGEIHGLRDHAGLVARVLGPLHERAGVRLLCSEFVRASQTERLQAILEAPAWDEQAAIDIMRAGPWPTWGWREYVDILRAAWAINAGRPEGAPPFRIAGIDDDWTQLALMDADRAASFRIRLDRESVMHESTRIAVAAHGPKTLVHVGAAHAVRHGIRLAERLHRDYGARCGYVILHHGLRTRDGISPLETMIDEAVVSAASGPVGFPVVGSPLARARDDALPPMAMLGPAAALEDFAPALIHVGPSDTRVRGRWIDGFIDARRFEEARTLALRLDWIVEDEATSPEALDAVLATELGGPVQ